VTKGKDEISMRICEEILQKCQQKNKRNTPYEVKYYRNKEQKYESSCEQINSTPILYFYIPEMHSQLSLSETSVQ
jgi:hypothetical protein